MPDANVNLGLTVTANISDALKQMQRLSDQTRGAFRRGAPAPTEEPTGALDRQARSLAGVVARTERLRHARRALSAGTRTVTLTERGREAVLRRLHIATDRAVVLERRRRQAVEAGNAEVARAASIGRSYQRQLIALYHTMLKVADVQKRIGIAGVARGGLAFFGGIARGARTVVTSFMHVYWAALSIFYAIRNIIRPFTDLVRTMVAGFQRVLGYAKQLVSSLIDISAEIEMLELRMRGLFGGAEGSRMMRWAMDTAVGLRFVWTDIANAMLKVQALGAEFLPRLGPNAIERIMPGIMDLAAMFGQSVEDAGAAVMKASTGFFMSLRRTYGIMPGAVIKYGGVAGPRGTLMGKTPEQQAKNLVAILRLIEDRYGGMAKATSKTFKALMDDMADLWARFGKELKDIGFLRPMTDALTVVRDTIMRTTSTGERELSPLAKRIAIQFTQWSERLRPVYMWFAERIEPMLLLVSNWLDRIGNAFDKWYEKVGGIEGIMMTVMEIIIDHAPAAIGIFRTYLSLILTIGNAVLTILQGTLEVARDIAAVARDVEKTEMFGRAAEAAEKAKGAIESIGERVGEPLKAAEERAAKAGAWRRYYREQGATREEALRAAGQVMFGPETIQGPPGYTYTPAGMPIGAGGAIPPKGETPLQRRNREAMERAQKPAGVGGKAIRWAAKHPIEAGLGILTGVEVYKLIRPALGKYLGGLFGSLSKYTTAIFSRLAGYKAPQVARQLTLGGAAATTGVTMLPSPPGGWYNLWRKQKWAEELRERGLLEKATIPTGWGRAKFAPGYEMPAAYVPGGRGAWTEQQIDVYINMNEKTAEHLTVHVEQESRPRGNTSGRRTQQSRYY